jgi:hypothetical protein
VRRRSQQNLCSRRNSNSMLARLIFARTSTPLWNGQSWSNSIAMVTESHDVPGFRIRKFRLRAGFERGVEERLGSPLCSWGSGHRVKFLGDHACAGF